MEQQKSLSYNKFGGNAHAKNSHWKDITRIEKSKGGNTRTTKRKQFQNGKTNKCIQI